LAAREALKNLLKEHPVALTAFLASGSVLHVVGFSGLVTTHFAESAVVDLRLSRGGFDAMTRFIHEEYHRDREDRPLRLERGLYGTTRPSGNASFRTESLVSLRRELEPSVGIGT
jgi:hypothetical protein